MPTEPVDPVDPLRRAQLRDALIDRFGADDPKLLDELEAAVTWVHLAAGGRPFAEGDPADDAFVVVSGRLRATAAQPDGESRLLAEMGAGELVGELALLTRESRSATVSAVRDADLARLDRARFEGLAARHAGASAAIARLVAERLRRATSAAPLVARESLVVVIAPLSAGIDAVGFGRRLAGALAAHGSVEIVDPARAREVIRTHGDASGATTGAAVDATREHAALPALRAWLDRLEGAARCLVLIADPTWTPWTERALHQADELVLLADLEGDPARSELEGHLDADRPAPTGPHRTLVLLRPDGTAPSATAGWLQARAVDEHLHLRRDVLADIERLARSLTGTSVGLVLGGGGARGFAHIGVLRAMRDLGIPIDAVGGTSSGALVGATHALGLAPETIQARAAQHVHKLIDPTLPLVSVFRGRGLRRGLEAVLGGGAIEDLALPYFAVATNLTRAELVVVDRGPLVAAVRASMSLPGVYPPVTRDGELLVDGGLLANVPIDVMARRLRGGRIVAVDVSPTVDSVRYDDFEPDLSGWGLLARRVRPFRRDRRRLPSIVETLNRAAVAGSVHLRQQRRPGTELLLRPPVERFGLLQMEALPTIAEAGYRGSIEALRAWWTGHPEADSELPTT
jgi:predicted acylesterase/phospholipase RssA/CRP-like cAMP-binding protein